LARPVPKGFADWHSYYEHRKEVGLARGFSARAAVGHAKPGEPSPGAIRRVERELAGGPKASINDWRLAVERHLSHRVARQPLTKEERQLLRQNLSSADRQLLKEMRQANFREWSNQSKEAVRKGLTSSPWWYHTE